MLYNLMQLKMQQINAKSDTSDWEIEASMIFDHSKTGIVGSNPNRVVDVPPMNTFLCVVLSCECRGLAKGQFEVQGVLPKYLKGLIVIEIDSDSEQAKWPNP
jgi:hypothetical protein